MRNRQILALALALIAGPAAGPAAAQASAGGARTSGPGVVQGMVTGAAEEGAPLSGAVVALHSAADSALAAGAITNESGHFRIAGIHPGAYYARISFLGHTTRYVPVSVAASSPRLDLGRLVLTVEAMDLGSVGATVQQSQARLQVDRTVFNARDLATAAGGQAADVLRSVPAVEVDADGNVSLRGNRSVAIQVNGRATPLQGEALAGFLRQMPASMIDRVEVIQNPSARHDPEGMGGIINLVLRQDAAPGMSGGVNASLGTGRKYGLNGNLGGQVGPLTLFGSYGLNSEDRDHSDETFRDNRFSDPATRLWQRGGGGFANGGHVLQLNADWKAADRDVLASTLMVNRIDNAAGTRTRYTLYDAGGTAADEFDRGATQDLALLMVDGSLVWTRTLSPERSLSTELRFTGSDDELLSAFDLMGPDGTIAERETNEFLAGYGQLAGQVDYTRPLGDATKLELGYRGTARDITNDFAGATFTGGSAAADSQWTSAFRYSEDVHAGYGVVTRTAGALQVQGGIRAELARTGFDLSTGEAAPASSYATLYPSASALYSISEARQVRLSYSKRVQRPHYRFLNPFAVAEDPRNIFVGNPELAPEYTHALELSLQQTAGAVSLQLMPFFRRTVDPIRRYKTVDAEGVATTTFRNMDASDALGADVSSTFRLGTALSGMVSVSGYHMATDGSAVEAGLGSEALIWNARGNLSWRITPALDAQWSLFHRGAVKVEQGRVEPFTVTNFALRQRVLGDRASISLRVSDPLDAMRLSFETEDANHWQTSWRKMESRIVYLGIGYTFGKPMRPRPNRPPAEAQPDDMGIR